MGFYPFNPAASSGAGFGIQVAAPTGVAATDSGAIRTAFAAATAAGGGYIVMQNGTYVGDTGTFAVPANTTWYFQQGTQLTVNCTGGATVNAITVASGGVLLGQGQGSGPIITASATFNARTLVSNATHTLQEWCYYQGMWFLVASGATIGTAVVEMQACFANSGLRDCQIGGGGSPGAAFNGNTPLLQLAGESAGTNGLAPVYVEDCWIYTSGGDCVLVTDSGQSGAVQVWMRNNTVEGPASGKHNVHLSGSGGGLLSVAITGLHCENDSSPSATSAGVYVDGCQALTIEDMSFFSSPTTNTVPVWITTSAHNGTATVKRLANSVDISPAIKNDNSAGNFTPPTSGNIPAGWVSEYSTGPVVATAAGSTSGSHQYGSIQANGITVFGDTSNNFSFGNPTVALDNGSAVWGLFNNGGMGFYYFNSGHTYFSISSAGAIASANNTLDNGSGAATFAGQLELAAGTTAVTPLLFQSGTLNTSAVAGGAEYDGVATYLTNETTSGRGVVRAEQRFRLTATGGNISTIANYFGTTSNISLVSGGEYEIEIVCWFLKTTSGTVTWTFTNSAAPTSMTIDYQMSPATGIVATAAATDLFGQQYNVTATAPTVVSGSLTSAVNHRHKFAIRLINGTGTSLQIQATASAGTITPGINSYWIARRVPAANVGHFAA